MANKMQQKMKLSMQHDIAQAEDFIKEMAEGYRFVFPKAVRMYLEDKNNDYRLHVH